MKPPKLFLFACLAAFPLFAQEAQTNWPQWRGHHLNGHSSESSLPIRWSPTENLAWKVPIPGIGHSSPIVWRDRIFLTSCIEREGSRLVLCISRAEGKILWQREVLRAAPLERKHKLNNYASSTPATDGKHVWSAFLEDPPDAEPRVWVICHDINGAEVWRKSPGVFKSMHGWASAIILHKDTLLLNLDQDDTASLVALKKETGDEVWRTDRPNRIRSYCNPLIVEAAGKTQMVLTGAKSTAAYDPDTGRQLWVMEGPTEQFVASPVFTDGVFFVTGGFPTYHYVGIRPEATGDISEDTKFVLYHETTGAYVPSPIGVGKHIFMVSDRPGSEGVVWCIEAKSGRRIWSQKLGRHHRPSPVYANGLLYFLSDEGITYVLRASDKFEMIAKNSLGEEGNGDRCFASPALSDGQIFIRTVEHLYCIKP